MTCINKYTGSRTIMLKSIEFNSDMYKTYKKKILNRLINKNKDLAPQGSPEWLAIREFSIGGSEMSTITGDNCYSKLDNLVSQKVGFTKFNGNIACRWGKMFEVVTQNITEIILDVDGMCETGSLQGSVQYQRYSPDGLGVVKMVCIHEHKNIMVESQDYCIILFEYKSPYSSIPMGFIPKHYLPQVKTGLCSIPIADFAIFINNMFRKCPLDFLEDDTKYDKDFHSKDKVTVENPLAMGVNIFYQTPEQQRKFEYEFNYVFDDDYDNCSESEDCDDCSSNKGSSENEDTQNMFNKINRAPIRQESFIHQHIHDSISKKLRPIDFGKSYYSDTNTLLELYDTGFLSIHYCEPHIFERYYNDEFLKAHIKKKPDKTRTINESVSYFNLTISTFNETNKVIVNSNKNINNSNKTIIGYMPWKLFKSDILSEERDPEYVNKYKHDIDKTIGIIKDIQNSTTREDKINKFKKYFPKSNILKNYGIDIDHSRFLPM